MLFADDGVRTGRRGNCTGREFEFVEDHAWKIRDLLIFEYVKFFEGENLKNAN